MTRLLIPLNQLVNPPRVSADSRPKLRRPPGDTADLKVGTTNVGTTNVGSTRVAGTGYVVPGFSPARLTAT